MKKEEILKSDFEVIIVKDENGWSLSVDHCIFYNLSPERLLEIINILKNENLLK